jgi:hypothetical protein
MTDFVFDPAADYKRRYKALIEEYGDFIYIPKQKSHELNERLRAHHVVEKARAEGKRPLGELISHSIDKDIIAEMVGIEGEDLDRVLAPKPKAKDSIGEWIKEHAGEEVSLNDVCEATGATYAQVNKFIKDNIGYATKIQKGKYLLRNPDLEREEAKKS